MDILDDMGWVNYQQKFLVEKLHADRQDRPGYFLVTFDIKHINQSLAFQTLSFLKRNLNNK